VDFLLRFEDLTRRVNLRRHNQRSPISMIMIQKVSSYLDHCPKPPTEIEFKVTGRLLSRQMEYSFADSERKRQGSDFLCFNSYHSNCLISSTARNAERIATRSIIGLIKKLKVIVKWFKAVTAGFQLQESFSRCINRIGERRLHDSSVN